MSQTRTPLVLHGLIHGKTIELEEETGLPEGEKVMVLLTSETELKSELEAQDTLEKIYRMRHMGRSIVKP